MVSPNADLIFFMVIRIAQVGLCLNVQLFPNAPVSPRCIDPIKVSDRLRRSTGNRNAICTPLTDWSCVENLRARIVAGANYIAVQPRRRIRKFGP